MSDDAQPTTTPLDRRNLLRGGAVLAGAAGATVLGAAMGPTAAEAANGNPVVLGATGASANTETSTTTIAKSGAVAGATLELNNGSTGTTNGGPSLKLQPLSEDFDADLQVGEIANTTLGPLIGVDYGDGRENTYLATGIDVGSIPFTLPLPPERRVKTNGSDAVLGNIVGRSSSGALSGGLLKAGQYIDVSVLPADSGIDLVGVFVNLTATAAPAKGYLTLYPSGDDRPAASTLNYPANTSIANGALVAVGEVGTDYAVRIYAYKDVAVVLDLTGLVAFPGTTAAAAQRQGAAQGGRRGLVKALKARVAKALSR